MYNMRIKHTYNELSGRSCNQMEQETKMILRLAIAFTRWVWGVSPAFVTADSLDWYAVMILGMVIDIAAIAISIVVLEDILSRRSK